MNSLVRGTGRLLLQALALALGIWVFSGSSAMALGGGFQGVGQHGHDVSGCGTSGYGGYGLYPGFYGFGLGYHLGYGYGGNALGVGADGGYPHYGGPGYPHPWPCLQRFGRIAPFHYYGGPGYPTYDQPHYFGATGPLVVNSPVVPVGSDPDEPGYASGYGFFSGAHPYPESFFAPYAAAAAATGSSAATSASNPPVNLVQGRDLGIDEEPVDADGARGLKVSKVYPGTVMEKAGLKAGDVILSINEYVTTKTSDLGWIIANAAPNHVLTMNVRTAADGKEHTITVQLPVERTPVDTSRPPYLPPVGNGPPPATR